tara:strand:+ start:61908 stop:62453 length:546 start_codon:yes stop_codon:yes gene_type:complete
MTTLALHDTDGKIERRDPLNIEDAVIKTDKQFMDSPEMEKIAEKVRKDKNIELGPAMVWMTLVYPNISKSKPAKTKKTSKEFRHHTGYDYMLQVSGELWDMLDDKTKYFLIWEELLKLDPTFKTKEQHWVMKLRKPNYSNFYEILDNEGHEEARRLHETIQATASSLYDLDPKQEDQISLF